MKLKVCGMKYEDNIRAIAELNPDYMGFIFYPKSKRNFDGVIPQLSSQIKKTGVFVNASLEEVVKCIAKYSFQAVQLHGDESVEYVKKLKELIADIEVIKVFGIKDTFDFTIIETYQPFVNYFLFDTKAKERGGTGRKFNWSVLENYALDTPLFLSGGITSEDVEEIKKIKNTGLPIYAVDINSKFEIEPGLKNSQEVKNFKNKLAAI